jgi:elongation factor 2
MCMSKSPNKHNRISAKASALDEGFAELVEEGKISAKDDPKSRAKYLNDTFGWDKDLAGPKLWSFGPENAGPNTLVDATKGV